MGELRELLSAAQEAVDEVTGLFVRGLGAPPAHYKKAGDFATDVDLRIEERLRSSLLCRTGIAVCGEESAAFSGSAGEANSARRPAGGMARADAVRAEAAQAPAGDTDATWVIDPIDGTANYSAGNPNCGILVALLIGGRPQVAVADFPLLSRRLVATAGSPLSVVGESAPAGRAAAGIDPNDHRHIGCSSHLPAALLDGLWQRDLRPRITGSVGLDNAFVAQGIFAGAVNFSPHPWDNAAGALLMAAAGAVVTDAAGAEWRAGSRSLVAGTAPVHRALLEAVAAYGEAYRHAERD